MILTILTQLELGEVQYLHLHPQMNVTCSLNFHKVDSRLYQVLLVEFVLSNSFCNFCIQCACVPLQTPPMDLAARDHLVAGILNKCVFYIKERSFCSSPI